MKKAAQRNSILLIVLILCTITIIWTNYIFIHKTVQNINQLLIENEYKKIWGKENYLILQELQKREIIGYIDSIKKEKPELIEEILKAEREEKIDKNNYKILDNNIIKDIKKDTFVLWNTWALVSVIEFSDMECPYCIKQHKKQITNKILEKYYDKVNFSFKNFPIPAHKNSNIESQAAKCIENISWWNKYLEYIDNIFNNTKWWWEWFKVKDLSPLAEKLWVNTEKFNSCLSKWNTKDLVEKEFKQWVMLWINSVPSNLIINNKTGEYIIISETIDYKEMEKIILDILK